MIYNRPRAKKKVSLTWYFNNTITITESVEYAAVFTLYSSDKSFIKLRLTKGTKQNTMQGIYEVFPGYTQKLSLYSNRGGWSKQEYRTITFEEEPTGDLLAFLEANATPQ